LVFIFRETQKIYFKLLTRKSGKWLQTYKSAKLGSGTYGNPDKVITSILYFYHWRLIVASTYMPDRVLIVVECHNVIDVSTNSGHA